MIKVQICGVYHGLVLEGERARLMVRPSGALPAVLRKVERIKPDERSRQVDRAPIVERAREVGTVSVACPGHADVSASPGEVVTATADYFPVMYPRVSEYGEKTVFYRDVDGVLHLDGEVSKAGREKGGAAQGRAGVFRFAARVRVKYSVLVGRNFDRLQVVCEDEDAASFKAGVLHETNAVSRGRFGVREYQKAPMLPGGLTFEGPVTLAPSVVKGELVDVAGEMWPCVRPYWSEKKADVLMTETPDFHFLADAVKSAKAEDRPGKPSKEQAALV